MFGGWQWRAAGHGRSLADAAGGPQPHQRNVQELTVEAALTGDVEAVHHAVVLDPLTSTVCTLSQARAMVDEMLEAQARWLPQFGEGLKV